MSRPDFVVIGASKSGTTTVFQYLRQHPRLYLPAHKDAFVFTGEAEPRQEIEERIREHFQDAPPDRLWGKVTPSYMEDLRIPERMYEFNSDMRLVALLRNPVDRLVSHYRQQLRLGKVDRGLRASVEPLLSCDALVNARQPSEFWRVPHYHPVRSEYALVLGKYLEFFPASQLLTVFTEHLAADPATVLDSIYRHLDLESGFRPRNLGKRYHVGGDRQRFPRVIPIVRRIAPIRWLWHRLPLRRRRALWTWFFTQVNVVPEQPEELDPRLRARLVEHFRDDVSKLEELIGESPPWPELVAGR